MELSRIKTLYCGIIFQLLFTFALPLPYTKYGRTCSDIGCLSSQVCVMAHDSCSLGQREGNECGRYPTCKKNTDPSVSAGPSAGVSNVYNNGPKPSAPVGSGGDDDVLGTLGLNPNNPYGQRPTPAPSRPASSGGLYPSLPTDNNPGNRYGGNGGSNGYNGGGGGGGGGAPAGGYGGGSSNGGYGGGGGAGGQFDGAGGGIVLPTRKPTAPASSGGFFGGILSGVQNAVSNAVKQQIGTYINQRLGIGPAAGGAAGGTGGLGGLFDARNLIDNKKLGGLFSENKPAGGGGGSASGQPIAGPGGYPVTVDQRLSASNYYAQPQQSYGQQYGSNTRATERPAYGWN